MMKHSIRRGDFYSGMVLACLGAYIISEASHWTYLGEEGPGAGFFPMWYGIAMLVLSLFLVLGAALKPGQATTGARDWKETRRSLTCWLAFSVCIVLFKLVGFMISFALLTWFMIAVMFRQSQRIAISVAIGSALGFYLLFSLALGISLPSGIFF
jgi:putative tricarboxylic transport membrane protein